MRILYDKNANWMIDIDKISAVDEFNTGLKITRPGAENFYLEIFVDGCPRSFRTSDITMEELMEVIRHGDNCVVIDKKSEPEPEPVAEEPKPSKATAKTGVNLSDLINEVCIKTLSDCSSVYDVTRITTFDVSRFIAALNNSIGITWGHLEVMYRGTMVAATSFSRSGEDSSLTLANDVILSKWGDSIVTDVKASGGYGRMDYALYVED